MQVPSLITHLRLEYEKHLQTQTPVLGPDYKGFVAFCEGYLHGNRVVASQLIDGNIAIELSNDVTVLVHPLLPLTHEVSGEGMDTGSIRIT
jgi:hypothetical protein